MYEADPRAPGLCSIMCAVDNGGVIIDATPDVVVETYVTELLSIYRALLDWEAILGRDSRWACLQSGLAAIHDWVQIEERKHSGDPAATTEATS
jgi:hypothetical protein